MEMRAIFIIFLSLCSMWSHCDAFKWPWEDDDGSSSSTSSSSSATSSSGSSSFPSSSSSSSTSGSSVEVLKPTETGCPLYNLLREAKDISPGEKDYITKKFDKTNAKLIDFLSNVSKLQDFDAEKFIKDNSEKHNITIGLAFSGGGYRAMLTGAGQILALDDRYDDAKKSGLGGLLQSSTYFTTLSGSAWLFATLMVNNWISIKNILSGETDVWNLDHTIFNAGGFDVFKTLRYYRNIDKAISQKEDSGFDATVTDVWGYGVMSQLQPHDEAFNFTFSDITQLSSFQDQEMPFPIVVSDSREIGSYAVTINSTLYEFNPYEMGSWDNTVKSFIDIRYLGTNLTDGKVNSSGKCTVDYDLLSLITGTSSSLFNKPFLDVSSSSMNSALKKVLKGLFKRVSNTNIDVAVFSPNPFYKSNYGTSQDISSASALHLCDGGQDDQNIPFNPLIQPSRKMDVIFSFDNSGDTEQNWPNGTSLAHTYARQFGSLGDGAAFPFVPSIADFLSDNYTNEPFFLGCDASNLTEIVQFHEDDIKETDIPLVIYIPNREMSYSSNTSTTKMSYDSDERNKMIQNGYETATSGNLTIDSKWATCVGCAIIRRQQERLGEDQSDECKDCFERYCYKKTQDLSEFGSLPSSSSSSSSSSRASRSPSSGEGGTSGQKTSSTKKSGASVTARIPILKNLINLLFISLL